MALFKRATVSVETRAETAARLSSEALGLFTTANDQLTEANNLLVDERADALQTIAAAEAAVAAADEQIERNRRVQSKLQDFVA